MPDNSDLKKAGLKVTVPRLKVLGLLEASDGQHMSAEDVYKALLESGDDVGLATVYRVLTHFEGGHAVFELASEEHHDHMVDAETGEVVEFFDEIIEQRQHEIAQEHGFELVDHSLTLYVRKKR